MKVKLSKFDPADYLDSEETIEAYLDEAASTGDSSHLARALGNVARARGMTEVATAVGASRPTLYHSLCETGNPTIKTVMKVLDVLGYRLTIERKSVA